MKTSFILTFLFSVFAVAASGTLSLSDFQNNELFKFVYVEEAKQVFNNELTGELLFEVTYLVEGECAAAGNADACEMVPYCEYVWVDPYALDNDYYMESTQKSCDADIEDILKPEIIDEL